MMDLLVCLFVGLVVGFLQFDSWENVCVCCDRLLFFVLLLVVVCWCVCVLFLCVVIRLCLGSLVCRFDRLMPYPFVDVLGC